METQKIQIIERLKQATNILVTVSANPSVDQLAGAIGLTLLLNKLNKHATAVFSGGVPSTLEFLQPDKTLEKNTDSLRDFIIALDKSKADKLRYKVEDQMVKIFITPYMTSISDKDLEFSQGDFNVEVVMALGVNEPQDLDQAITTHGRILHDATVISINTQAGGSLGSINWIDDKASSLCEMLVSLGLSLKQDVLDGQMATALLTGIVAETNRFSNEKTSSETMQISAKLMTAGANQQLVASQLQPPAPEPAATEESAPEEDLELPEIKQETDQQSPDQPDTTEVPAASETTDGTLQIRHGEAEEPEQAAETASDEPVELPVEQIHIDEEGTIKPAAGVETPEPNPGTDPVGIDTSNNARFIVEPPTLGGTLTANSLSEELEPSTDMLGTTNNQGPMLSHTNDSVSADVASAMVPLPSLPSNESDPAAAASPVPTADPHPQTLAELESLVTDGHVDSQPDKQEAPHVELPQTTLDTPVNAARDAVSQAMTGTTPQILEPVKSLNAHPVDLNLGDMPAVSTSLASAFASNSSAPALDDTPLVINPTAPVPLVPFEPSTSGDDSSASVVDPNAPPPVPPPMMPPGQFTP